MDVYSFLFFLQLYMGRSYFRDSVSTETREIYKRPKKQYLPIIAHRLNEIWQIDLYFIKTLNVKVVLSVIDIYSRKGWVVRLSNKRTSTTLLGFKYAVKKMGNLPEVIMMDGGSEFKQSFTEYLEENGVEIRVARGDALANSNIKLSQAIVERYNRTMRELLASYMVEENRKSLTQKDFDILSEDYNDRKHRTIRASPNEVVAGTKLPKQKLQKYHLSKAPFAIGDKVRILKQSKNQFKHKDKPNYSKDVYEVIKQKYNRFKLNDGEYYPYTRLLKSELTVTKVKKKPVVIPRRKQPIRKVKQQLRKSTRLQK